MNIFIYPFLCIDSTLIDRYNILRLVNLHIIMIIKEIEEIILKLLIKMMKMMMNLMKKILIWNKKKKL